MSNGIFLIQDDGSLVQMNASAYDSEDLLQGLLEKYPSLLAGDQLEVGDPCRWALVRREMGIPGEEDGSDRWSVDHLFLDQAAIPTLVEVKRSSDTRIRREVVGQMLDYAANAVIYWPVEQIKAEFESTCHRDGSDPDSVIADLVDGEMETEEFWQRVKTNLRAGKVRLLFVADKIPSELRRVIEFLNTQMDPAQVLGIEIKQFVGENMKTLVPQVVGQTEEATGRKGTASRTKAVKISEEEFFTDLRKAVGDDNMDAAHKLVDWLKASLHRIEFWNGPKKDGVGGAVTSKQNGVPFSIKRDGKIIIPFGGWMKVTKPFDSDSKRKELLDKLNEIPAINIPETDLQHHRAIAFSDLQSEEELASFLRAFDWYMDEVRAIAD